MSVQLHYKVIPPVHRELPFNVPSVYVLLIRSQLEPRIGKRNTREIACASNCVEAKKRGLRSCVHVELRKGQKGCIRRVRVELHKGQKGCMRR